MEDDDHNSVRRWLSERLEHYLAVLERLVGINSFTLNHAGIAESRRQIAELFAPLGFTAEEVPAAESEFASHLLLRRAGTGLTARGPGAGPAGGWPSGARPKGLMLISHLDTVFPPEEEAANNFRWRRDGSRIFGPGVMDIKGGTVMILMLLEALREFRPELFEGTTWLVGMNAAEERGAPEFPTACLERAGAESVACLVFEAGKSSGLDFQIVTARKGRFEFRIDVDGRGAHSGVDHGHGANAVLELAKVIAAVESKNDPSRTLSVNIGRIGGGETVNRVPHHAWAEGEARSFDPDALSELLLFLEGLRGPSSTRSPLDGFPVTRRPEIKKQMPGWPESSATLALFQHWQAAAKAMGGVARPEARGGLSDANYFADRIPTLDGLGPCGGNAHCSERSADGSKVPEYLDSDSMVPKALLNFAAVCRLLRA